jgi:phage shock protein C
MYCPGCGKATDAGVRFCPNCGAQINAGAAAPGAGYASAGAPAGTYPAGAYAASGLMRPRFPRMIAGVCAAFALQYGWDVTLVRVITAGFAILTSGMVGLAYLAAWVIIPEAPYALPPGYVAPANNGGMDSSVKGSPSV